MDKVDWEGLKAKYAIRQSVVGGQAWTGEISEQFPAILAAHERDQRVIAAAEKMRYDFSEENRAEYDKAKR